MQKSYNPTKMPEIEMINKSKGIVRQKLISNENFEDVFSVHYSTLAERYKAG